MNSINRIEQLLHEFISRLWRNIRGRCGHPRVTHLDGHRLSPVDMPPSVVGGHQYISIIVRIGLIGQSLSNPSTHFNFLQ